MKERRDVFFAIADENRRAILTMLAKENKPLTVNTIAADFDISREGVSKHIKVLSESGLVSTSFQGRENYVTLEAMKLTEVYHWISIFETFWTNKLAKLKNIVESQNKKK
jgi:DNA-binding transcriptional ArsR family regulator